MVGTFFMPESKDERRKRISRETSARYRARNLEKARKQHRDYRARNIEAIRIKDRDFKRKKAPKRRPKKLPPSKAQHQAAYRLRQKKINCRELLGTWPYCRWKMFTDTPCRKQPSRPFYSSPMCEEHWLMAQEL